MMIWQRGKVSPGAEGARFENPAAPETVGSDLPSSFQTQSLTEEPEVGEKPVNLDRTR